MQTVLGANGQIGEELARYLHDHVTQDIRLVGRTPARVNATDEPVAADLLDAAATEKAVAGSDIVYLTVGLPMDSALWEARFPQMMENTIAAVREHGAKLVFFDNTYMYPQTAVPQVEGRTPFEPRGRKAAVRARITTRLQQEMDAGRIEAVIVRAPEFYGPGKTQGLTNTTVFDRIKAGKRPLVPVSADTRRSLIWTPDASRAMGLIGNTPDAYGRTWHLPIDQDRRTYRELIAIAAEVTGRTIPFSTIPLPVFTAAGLINAKAREASELLPRYGVDNIFDTTAFANRFPDFIPTSYRAGITQLLS
ncbi:NAD-dependent dehydratase [Tsukamurella pulmonis]|uniref:Nucleoside-diphosphate-sugar epimerase n=1 Tax=Tsukamurella pulmonis TaxID=47312 RepID=A0A1H0Y011_9ACTN|nr:NAD-dependent epimerase/dehydratase family protein [Tsukamurella pulmonis]KXO94275.1 NAD-dependent epimerase [Tsukamurella pulmonis]KXP11703.1 NAD-dependent epimerase [Tsukamurella pulmonis]RDH11584.1 NAD-dependent epimerase/dehydratase family protein [Tsukamurella pulmonis]SDQ08492.1 Nucleoside-diphosphate-sugar epimerase [Tsukamurella pulmonis]SUP12867.1 Putative NADH-flavin reductase [Tsukamurella pulmonis]